MAPMRRRLAGFTLIELLVVIAIIAILTAILLPVFASVRENSRQSVVISNLKDISQKMEQYKLDNHKYPDVLFGYAVPGTTMKTGLAAAQANGTASVYFPGLYPAYIKDPDEFTDPNNTADPNAAPANQVTGQLPVNIVAPCYDQSDMTASGAGTSPCTVSGKTPAAGQVLQTKRSFYVLDAYDSNPPVTGGNQINNTPGSYVPRYQLAREGTVCPSSGQVGYCDATVAPNDVDYKRQLRWKNPPASTVVTLTPYHVQNADKVLVLFESGAVKKVKAEDFLGGVANTDNAANSWRYGSGQ